MRILILAAMALAMWVLPCGAAEGKAAAGRVQSDYRLQPEDSITISVVGEATLTDVPRKVTSSGTITYPYLGEVKVVNKTPAEVEDEIRTLLDKDYIINPQVIVQMKEYRARRITVLGEVARPGVYDLPVEQRTDLVRAIAGAGGLTKIASKSKIEVTRAGKTERFNFDELKKTEDPEKKYWLQPDDVVSVGESIF